MSPVLLTASRLTYWCGWEQNRWCIQPYATAGERPQRVASSCHVTVNEPEKNNSSPIVAHHKNRFLADTHKWRKAVSKSGTKQSSPLVNQTFSVAHHKNRFSANTRERRLDMRSGARSPSTRCADRRDATARRGSSCNGSISCHTKPFSKNNLSGVNGGVQRGLEGARPLTGPFGPSGGRRTTDRPSFSFHAPPGTNLFTLSTLTSHPPKNTKGALCSPQRAFLSASAIPNNSSHFTSGSLHTLPIP